MNDDRKTLTTRQGHPVADNQSLRSVGERGPATLEDYQFIEKITHSIASGFPNGSSMRAAPAPMAGSKLSARSAMSRHPSIPGPRF
jgi:hypothetical protein